MVDHRASIVSTTQSVHKPLTMTRLVPTEFDSNGFEDLRFFRRFQGFGGDFDPSSIFKQFFKDGDPFAGFDDAFGGFDELFKNMGGGGGGGGFQSFSFSSSSGQLRPELTCLAVNKD